MDSRKNKIKTEILLESAAGDCRISSSPSLILENVAAVQSPQLLNEPPDNEVIMVSDFIQSPILLGDVHHLNSVSVGFNPVSFLNDNTTSVTWCNDSVLPLPSAQPGLYSHLINGQKIVQNERSLNGETSLSLDIMSDCVKTKILEQDSVTPDSMQPLILITATISQPNSVPKVTSSVSRTSLSSKSMKEKSSKRKNSSKVMEMKKSLKMKEESSNPDDCLSSVSDASVLNHSNEIMNSLLLNGDNLSSLFPNPSSLQTSDLSSSNQIDLSNAGLSIQTFDPSKIDGKKFVYKPLDCDATLMGAANFPNDDTLLAASLAKSKTHYSTPGLNIYMNSNSECVDNCIKSGLIKSPSVTSKTNAWDIKLKQKETLASDKMFISADSDPILESTDNFLTSLNLGSSLKSIDLFDDKIQSDSGLSIPGASVKLKTNTVEPEIENMELNALHLGSSPPGYTAQLLSQLSHAHSLPSISSSQVSSVFSALEHSEKHIAAGDLVLSQMESMSNNQPIKAENIQENEDEDVKVVDGPDEILDYKLKTKTKAPPQKFQLVKCELNGYACYKCGLCPYLSMTQQSVITHFQQHQSKLLRRAIRCIGCKNQFYSKFLLKAHLLQDHEVLVDELHPILDAVIAANKPQAVTARRKQSKFSLIAESIIPKEPEINIPLATTSTTVPQPVTISSSVNLESDMIATPSDLVSMDILTSQPMMEPLEPVKPLEPLEPLQPSQPIQPLHPSDSVVEEPIATITSWTEPIVEPHPLSIPHPEGSMSIEGMEISNNITSNINGHGKVEGEEITLVNSLCQVKPDTEKKKAKKTKVRPVAIKKLLNQEESSASSGLLIPGIPPIPPKFKKNSNNGLKCGLDGCTTRFSDSKNLQLHHQYHDLENSTFKCLDCDHKNPDWNRFSLHLWRSHSINVDLYSCALCNYKTSSRSILLNLHYRIHGEERPFLCDLCGKGFKTTKQLRNHKAVHRLKAISVAETKEILCNICGCSFSNLRKLQLHENNIHKKLRPYLCNYCGHKASSRSSLRMHIRQHTGEKPFSCNECDYVTGDHNSMRRHKMRHSGAKRYSCPHCSYACIQSNTYKSHLQRKHPGLDEGLMFCCHLCSFVSVKKENLMSHMMEHKDDESQNDSKLTNKEESELALMNESADNMEFSMEQKVECKDLQN
nr:PREDICTED: uncharacterized protein LOC109033706 isoform X2 [Bemisia tabaci]